MITEIVYVYPAPTINIGGSHQRRTARIKLSACIDSGSLKYESVRFDGISTNNWTIDDLQFIAETTIQIHKLCQQTLAEVILNERKG